jgi:hypothetical protein
VLKAVGNVREVLKGLLLRESLGLVVLKTQLRSISGPMAEKSLQSKVLVLETGGKKGAGR